MQIRAARMRCSLTLAWIAAPVLGILLLASASAQEATFELNAVAGPALPAGTPISVQAAEFTDLNNRLQEVVEKALTARGYTVQADAPFILSYDTEMSGQTDPEAPGFRDSGAEEAAREMENTPGWNDGGGELGRDEPDMDDSNIASIPLESSPGTTPNNYSLSFILGRDGSPAIWQGSVTAALPARDPFETAEAMVPVLADHIGQTVRDERIPIN